jgi:hypothetical protein
VLTQLAADTAGSDRTMALHAAARYGYNVAAGMSLAGNTSGAAETLTKLQERLGVAAGANPEENRALRFATGALSGIAGDPGSGIASLEELRKQDAGYKLRNGTKVDQVLAWSYYQAGLGFLAAETPDSARQALGAFEQAERYGSGKEADVVHGKALAYRQMGQTDKMNEELAKLEKLDPDYYRKITSGS